MTQHQTEPSSSVKGSTADLDSTCSGVLLDRLESLLGAGSSSTQVAATDSEVHFSEGFLDRVEAAVLNKEVPKGVLDLGEVDLEDLEVGETLQVQQKPWQDIKFSSGFLERVDAEFSSVLGQPSNQRQVIDLDLEDYDLCDDLDLPVTPGRVTSSAVGVLEALTLRDGDGLAGSLMATVRADNSR